MDKSFENALPKIKYHFLKLYEICDKRFEHGCGSYLFDGKVYKYLESNYDKQKLLYEKSLNKVKTLEIGTYMGHSALIMLYANPKMNITTIDINDKYSYPATEYLKKNFPESEINFIKDDSLKALRKLKNMNKKFDFFHIDGSHKNKIITKEFNYCLNLSSSNKLEIIFDDDVTCNDLISNIKSTFTILENKFKGFNFVTNQFLKIKIHDNKYLRIWFNSKFLFKNIISYIKVKFFKLISLKKI
jgi:hypothetical protein